MISSSVHLLESFETNYDLITNDENGINEKYYQEIQKVAYIKRIYLFQYDSIPFTYSHNQGVVLETNIFNRLLVYLFCAQKQNNTNLCMKSKVKFAQSMDNYRINQKEAVTRFLVNSQHKQFFTSPYSQLPNESN